MKVIPSTDNNRKYLRRWNRHQIIQILLFKYFWVFNHSLIRFTRGLNAFQSKTKPKIALVVKTIYWLKMSVAATAIYSELGNKYFLYLNTKYMLKMYLNTKYCLQMYLNTFLYYFQNIVLFIQSIINLKMNEILGIKLVQLYSMSII